MSCDRADVLSTAKDLHMSPTEEQIQYVIENFDAEAERDPTGDWELWIENLLVQQDIPQNPPPEKFKYYLYDMTSAEISDCIGEFTEEEAEKFESNSIRAIKEHQMLVEKALVVIVDDVNKKDLTVIEELLQTIPKDKLINFLAED